MEKTAHKNKAEKLSKVASLVLPADTNNSKLTKTFLDLGKSDKTIDSRNFSTTLNPLSLHIFARVGPGSIIIGSEPVRVLISSAKIP